MTTSELNTYAWYVEGWEYWDILYESVISAVDTSADWEVTLTMIVLPSQSGVAFYPYDKTMTADGNYFTSGCEISLMTAPDQIMFRRSPSTAFTASSVSTKTLIPPAILPRPSSTSNEDAQTVSATDATYSASFGSSDSASSTIATQSSDGSQSTVAISGSDRGIPSLGGGAIAGIVIGAIVLLASIIGGWFFWRRRKRAKESGLSSGDDEQVRREENAGVPSSYYNSQEKQTHHHPGHVHELPEGNQAPVSAQELDISHWSSSTMTGARHSIGRAEYNYEPAYELHPDSRLGELPDFMDEQTFTAHRHDLEPTATTTGSIEMAGTSSDAASPHIEAQRRREMEWLDMEEERIRKRRETLTLQGGVNT